MKEDFYRFPNSTELNCLSFDARVEMFIELSHRVERFFRMDRYSAYGYDDYMPENERWMVSDLEELIRLIENILRTRPYSEIDGTYQAKRLQISIEEDEFSKLKENSITKNQRIDFKKLIGKIKEEVEKLEAELKESGEIS